VLQIMLSCGLDNEHSTKKLHTWFMRCTLRTCRLHCWPLEGCARQTDYIRLLPCFPGLWLHYKHRLVYAMHPRTGHLHCWPLEGCARQTDYIRLWPGFLAHGDIGQAVEIRPMHVGRYPPMSFTHNQPLYARSSDHQK
jgi:hypothetical protein